MRWLLPLAGLFCLLAGAAAAQPCAGPLSGGGQPWALPDVLSEGQRMAVSKVAAEALRKPTPDLTRASRCVSYELAVEGETINVMAGDGDTPIRWMKSEVQGMTIYLTSQDDGEGGKDYLLLARNEAGDFLFQLYTGEPSESVLRKDLLGLLDGSSAPIALYDRVGDAVTLFRPSQSGLMSHIFGPTPKGEKPAKLYGPDGRYFLATGSRAPRLASSGFVCPETLGEFRLGALSVHNGEFEHLALQCDYGADELGISLYAIRRPSETAQSWFEAALPEARRAFPTAKIDPGPVPVGGRNGFEFGRIWVLDTGGVAGLWTAQLGEHIVEVRGRLAYDKMKVAGAALSRLNKALADARR